MNSQVKQKLEILREIWRPISELDLMDPRIIADLGLHEPDENV